jgi:hypothetical protein
MKLGQSLKTLKPYLMGPFYPDQPHLQLARHEKAEKEDAFECEKCRQRKW